MAAKSQKTAAPRTVPEGSIAMVHPQGGRCDAYKPDRNGVHYVPVDAVATMLAHGFVPKED